MLFVQSRLYASVYQKFQGAQATFASCASDYSTLFRKSNGRLNIIIPFFDSNAKRMAELHSCPHLDPGHAFSQLSL